jgi:integrase/recombinase XerD
MRRLRQAVEDYLKMRRGLGFQLRNHGSALRDFIGFLEREGASDITTELALGWATQPSNAKPIWWASRLSMVRGFALYWSATEPRTEVPPLGLIPPRYQRRQPYIYTDEEVTQLMEAAQQLAPTDGLRPWTFSTLFGLVGATGVRHSEALALNRDEINWNQGVLSIQRTKFGKSRLVPIHESTLHALEQYSNRRDQIHSKPSTLSFFLSSRGTRLTQWSVRQTFVRLSHQIGLRSASDSHGPHLHDLRHRFAVKTLLGWYRAGVDVERHMPLLSTYLGHTHVADTYWYLSAVPELLALANARREQT